MHHPTDRIAHTTAFVTPIVEHWLELEKAQWVHPMKDRSDDPSHRERTLLPRSYISLPEWYEGWWSWYFIKSTVFLYNVELMCDNPLTLSQVYLHTVDVLCCWLNGRSGSDQTPSGLLHGDKLPSLYTPVRMTQWRFQVIATLPLYLAVKFISIE